MDKGIHEKIPLFVPIFGVEYKKKKKGKKPRSDACVAPGIEE